MTKTCGDTLFGVVIIM